MSNVNVNGLSGREIAGCELLRELGSGSSGVVYLANQKRLDRLVACKLLRVENTEDQLFVKSLFAEARNAAKLAHPNVVQALDVGVTEDGINYFIMEYADGSSLETIRLEHPEIISPRFLLDLSLQLAGALDYAWENYSMIHGDIKPGNMLIRSNDHQLKLCDLGLAHSTAGEDDSTADDVMVTPLYAAPEIIRRQKRTPDPRSDIYSFGVMLYELCCGAAPFRGSLEEIIEGHLAVTPQPLIRQNPDMDGEMAAFIDRMLKKDPAERPANWKEVRSVLGAVRKRLYPDAMPIVAVSGNAPVTGQTRTAVTGSFGDEVPKTPGFLARHPMLLPAVLLAVILLAVGAILLQMR
ncbi:MAG: serine/threonine protein kinase [Lentisphaeria bacterium]|nr:serine/threonine protein kinase [Lentisphaeria bacterium]